MEKMRVGVVGCGMISEIYLQNMTTLFTDVLAVVACADVDPLAAEARAEKFGLQVMTVEELLRNPQIDIVVNLTVPASHYDISKQALLAGKHAYSEKPLALRLEDGQELLAIAKEKQLCVCAAPDTFLGAGIQTGIRLIDEGAIGRPVFANGLMLSRGPESFHPNPGFFYQAGAGPLLDMGPYYLTALVALFGPAKRVNALTHATFDERTVLNVNSPHYQKKFPCKVDTMISTGIEFENNVIANVVTTWDLSNAYWDFGLPLLEVFGTKGALILPDPNCFGGLASSPMAKQPGKTVKLRRGDGPFEEIPLVAGFTENSRGLGVADFAKSLQAGGAPRVSGDVSLHVLELMLGALKASETGQYHQIQSTCKRPASFYTE